MASTPTPSEGYVSLAGRSVVQRCVCIALESRMGFVLGQKQVGESCLGGLIDGFYRLVVKLWLTWCSVFCFLALIAIWNADGWPDS